jgi:hypothetical protein
MKRAILAAAVSLMFATPAFAFHCPGYMAQIDEALAKNPALSAEQLAEVQTLRKEGEDLHNAGDHAKSVESLEKAMDILGIEE